jgi:hypothetical protein
LALSEANAALAERLKPSLIKLGFRFRSAALEFVRPQPFGFQRFSWATHFVGLNGGHQVINPGLSVRHDAVDSIVNRLGHIWGDDNQRRTTTLYRGLTIFPFDPLRDGEKVIRLTALEEDTSEVVGSLSDMLNNNGLPFLDQYSSLLVCSRGLNEPVEARTHPLLNNFPLRAYYGVAAAGLSEPSRVPSLIRGYADYAERENVKDAVVYEVGKDLSGVEAIVTRLEIIARWAAQSLKA